MTEIAQTSVYLTVDDQRRLREIREATGLSRSAVIRLALHSLSIEEDERRSRLLKIAEEIKRLA